MREHHPRAPRKGGRAHGPKAHDGTITTGEPDAMWGTDMTTAVATDQGTVHVSIAVGRRARECIGLHAAEKGDRSEAPEPPRRGVREHLGTFEANAARGPTIRHDHGGAYMSDDSRRGPESLGAVSSPSFARGPGGNGRAGRPIRTLKEQPPWVRTFATAEELAGAPRGFERTYNERWLIGRPGHRTPSQARRDLAGADRAAA